jgi:hypothetical protein
MISGLRGDTASGGGAWCVHLFDFNRIAVMKLCYL